MLEVRDRLLSLKDGKYFEFTSKLVPNVASENMIGIRIPTLRELAKRMNDDEADRFMRELPHKYFEENNLHAFLIEKIKDFDECISEVERFLPYVDNWATCDSMRPKCFKLNTDRLIHHIESWLKSDKAYTLRFGIEMLMVFYLDERFKEDYLYDVARIRSEEYYVNMMIAWYFATALSKQYDETIKILENNLLHSWVHNKTISKARESFRISPEKKEYLKQLKI